jgi:spore germination protein YaaH
MFTYVPTTTPSGAPVSSQLSNSANVAAAAAALAASNNSNHTFNVLWWSDAQAIAQKVALAKKLGIRGVSVFKWDGGQDPGMWATLQTVK